MSDPADALVFGIAFVSFFLACIPSALVALQSMNFSPKKKKRGPEPHGAGVACLLAEIPLISMPDGIFTMGGKLMFGVTDGFLTPKGD